MRGVLEWWPKRVIAAVAAAAVMLAAIIGAYGHASAHGHEHPAVQAHDHAPGHDHEGTSGGPAPTGDDHAACLDMVCHGGQAIVAQAVIGNPVQPPVPFTRWVTALHSTLPLPLDRPPKSTSLV